MNTFETMGKLIDEFDKMCKVVEMENADLERKIEEKEEMAYFNMCTDLAPYYAFYLDKKLPSIYIELDMEIKYYGEICIPVVCFHGNAVYIATKNKLRSYNGLNMNPITRRRDFDAYENLKYIGGVSAITDVAKVWNKHAKEFERKFMLEVQKILTNKAEKLNNENEKLRRGLETC